VPDANGNTITGHRRTIHFSASDVQSGLPANYTFVSGDSGKHQFGVTFDTAGNQTVTATDTNLPSLLGTGPATAVTAAAATHFVVSTASPSIAGNAAAVSIVALDPFGNTDTGYTGTVHLTVILPGSAELRLPVTAVATARDAFGNIANGYTGTVHFTSSDPNAEVPPNYTLVLGDGGVRYFSVAFDTLGVQTVTVTSTGGGPITGTSPATDAQSTMAPSTREVTGRRPQLGRRRASIVGFQLGGPVAVLPAAVNVATTAGGTATASLGTANTKGSIAAVATGAGT